MKGNLLIFFLFSWYFANSQDFNSVQQLVKTESVVLDFFGKSHLEKSNIYIFYIPPMKCPRCEGLIEPIRAKLLSQIDTSSSDVVAVINYPYYDVAANYLKNKNLNFSNLLIEEGYFSRNLAFQTQEALVPYLLKFNKQGQLVYQKAFLGKINWDDEVRKAAKAQKKLKQATPEKKKRRDYNITIRDTLKPLRTVLLSAPPSHPIAKITYPFITSDAKYFVFSDDVTLCTKVFDAINGQFIHEFCSNDSLNRLFSPDLTDSVYRYFKDINLISPMFFRSSDNEEEACIYITASLPKIMMMGVDKGETNWGSSNESVVLKYNLRERELERIINFSENTANPVLLMNHTDGVFFSNARHWLLPVEKGIPNVGASMADTVNGNNPYSESFYREAPLFAVMTSSGEFIRYLGKLDEFSVKNRLGYSITYPVACHNSGKYYVNSGTSDKVHIYDSAMLELIDSVLLKPYYLDPIRIKKLSLKPEVKKSLDYLLSFDPVFGASVQDLHAHGDKLSVLWHLNPAGFYGEPAESIYLYQQYSKGDKGYAVVKESILPRNLQDMLLQTAKVSNGKVMGIYQGFKNSCLVSFE